MRGSKLTTAVMVIAMLTVAMVPGAVAAADSDQSLQVSVMQDVETGNATVTVTQNDTNNTAVENATVEVVESSVNYSATNTSYTTDANGTVELPNPNETVTVTLNVTAEGDNETTKSVEAELIPHSESLDISVVTDNGTMTATVTQYENPVENASVEVNGTDYNESGETDENGTVEFDEPTINTTETTNTTNTTNTTETVELTFTASANNETAKTTVTLGNDESTSDDPFGALVTSFIEQLKQNSFEGPMGQAVSDFVTENNPGKADEKRPDHAGQKDKGKDKGQQGPPEHAKKGSADAGSTDDDSTTTTESDDDSEDDNSKEKSNNGKGNGNSNGNGNDN